MSRQFEYYNDKEISYEELVWKRDKDIKEAYEQEELEKNKEASKDENNYAALKAIVSL